MEGNKENFLSLDLQCSVPLAFRNFVSGKSEKKSLLFEIVGYVLLFKMWFNECRMRVLCFDLNLKLLIFLLFFLDANKHFVLVEISGVEIAEEFQQRI